MLYLRLTYILAWKLEDFYYYFFHLALRTLDYYSVAQVLFELTFCYLKMFTFHLMLSINQFDLVLSVSLETMLDYMYIKLHFVSFPQEGEVYRLEHQVQRLETEILRKDVKILQLEKQLQTALYSRTQVR